MTIRFKIHRGNLNPDSDRDSRILDAFLNELFGQAYETEVQILDRIINSHNSLCNLLRRTPKKDLSDMTLR